MCSSVSPCRRRPAGERLREFMGERVRVCVHDQPRLQTKTQMTHEDEWSHRSLCSSARSTSVANLLATHLSSLSLPVFLCVSQNVYMCVCVYVGGKTSREREREAVRQHVSRSPGLLLAVVLSLLSLSSFPSPRLSLWGRPSARSALILDSVQVRDSIPTDDGNHSCRISLEEQECPSLFVFSLSLSLP